MAKATYQALGPLLSGDGSRAFLGLQISEGALPRPIVLVWVSEEVSKDPQLAAKVVRETERASALVHPNVLKVHGLAALDEGLARVVEFADGEPLRKILDTVKRLPPRLAALVVADAAMGVHYAHLAGQEEGTPFLHGDIRPETLLVSFSGVCKVAGYGALGVAPREPGGRRMPGRRWHCAPEQVVGGREAVNRQTDVYLLGLVLYECLTGQIPFKDDPRFDDAVVNRPFPTLLPEDVPPSLIRVVEQATAKRAYDRFPTARAVRDAIERALGVLPAHEELAIFLRRFFPEDSPARVARRREIDSGLAEFARREAERITSDAPTGEDSPQIAPPPKARLFRPQTGFLLLLTLVLLGAWYAIRENGLALSRAPSLRQAAESLRRELKAAKLPEPGDEQPVEHETAAPSERTDPSLQEQISPTAAGEGAAQPPTPQELPSVQRALAKASAIGAEVTQASGALELSVEPAVDVRIDGRPVGRTPLNITIAPGTHSVQLREANRGINISRSIQVAADRKTVQRLVIGKGTVEISAPDGTVIYIDGKPVGTAPVGEISVYEGKHRILATVGTAKWQQGFDVAANERMSFKIQTVEQ
jgi:serine/threonine-protein kinase